MTVRIHVTVASIATAVAAFAAVVPACAGGDKVAFPENHAAGVLFTTVDRPDNKQFRDLYTSAEALDAAKKGEPLPSGTVITLIQYAAKLDAQGNPEKDANGRFIKGNLIGYTVMEKRTGWGTEYPDDIRNGEWEYQAFKADKSPNTAAILPPASTATSRSTSRISSSSTTSSRPRRNRTDPCRSQKSYPHVAMMQSGQGFCGDSGPRLLDESSSRCVLVHLRGSLCVPRTPSVLIT